MPSHRRASACFALLGVLLLVVMPCTTTTGAVIAAAEATTLRSYVDYFVGDLFQNPSSSMNRNKEQALPRFRPWRIINVPDDGVLAFGCVGDVPTLRIVPRSDDRVVDNNSDTTSCGRAQAETTPTQYKFTRPGGGNDSTGISALFWGQRPFVTAGEEGEGAPPTPLMPVPKFQLKAILKTVAALMELSWREESGDKAMPESVAFSGDMVVFYFNFDRQWLVAMGREDVDFRQPSEKLHGEFKALNLGTVV